MKGALLVFVASIVALATGQDCPAYYVRSQDGQSCYRYFNIRMPYRWACEFCEMVTNCGNGPAKMGALASISSLAENIEIYRIVAGFSQDNQMEREVWIGWNSINPYIWEDGSPAYPHGFAAFVSGGFTGGNGWPVNPQMVFGEPPGFAPVMRREFETIPGRRMPNGRFTPPMEGPVWYLSELQGSDHAFVCEVPIGQSILPNQPGFGPNQPGFGPNQPGFGPNQPGFGPNLPGPGPNQPWNPTQGAGPNQPGRPNRPGTSPNQPWSPNQPRINPNRPGTPPNQPRINPNQPGTGPNQPRINPNQPGTGPNQPRINPNQPGTGPNQPRINPSQPGTGPNQRPRV